MTMPPPPRRRSPRRRPHVARLTPCALLAWCALIATPPVAADLIDAELLDARLERRVVRLASVGPERLSYFNDRRELESAALDEIVRITPIAPPKADAPLESAATDETQPVPRGLAASITVELTNGQRYAGAAWRTDRVSGALALDHPTLGEVTPPLDIVAAVMPASPTRDGHPTLGVAPDEPAPIADAVVLVNGDSFDGFVDALGPDGVTLVPEAGDPLTLPLDRIAAVRLVNPPEPEPTEDHRLTLHDGSRLYGRGLSLASGSLIGEQGGRLLLDARLPGAGWREVSVRLDEVARVDLAGYRLVPLADLEVDALTPGEVFGVEWPVEASGDGWLVHAPTTARWRLPAGATRVALRAELATGGLTAPAAALADCEVRWVAEGEGSTTGLGSRRLIGLPHRPTVEPTAHDALATSILAELPEDATSLVVVVDDGVNGPIADRVRLHGPGVLVVGSPESRSAY